MLNLSFPHSSQGVLSKFLFSNTLCFFIVFAYVIRENVHVFP